MKHEFIIAFGGFSATILGISSGVFFGGVTGFLTGRLLKRISKDIRGK